MTSVDRVTAPASAKSCWICKSSNSKLWKPRNLDRELRPEDLQITDSRYGMTLTLLKCGECGFIFAEGKEVEALTALYEQLVDSDYEQGIENRALQMKWLIDIGLSQRPGAKSMLEIGSGVGLLIKEAQSRGLDAVGVEPSRSLVQAATQLTGVQLLQGIFPHPALAGRRFDIIYMVDVIEHVSDPVGLIQECGKALAPGGVLIVVTPDIGSMAAKILGHRWWHLRLAHVGYFDDRSMERAASAAGLKVLNRKRALWFFPVHYLAERVSVYLPVEPLVRMTKQPLRALYQRVVKVNLRDSTVFLLSHK